MKEEELLSWLIHQKRHNEIPEVTNKIVDKLIDTVPYLAVLFCKYSNFYFLHSFRRETQHILIKCVYL